MGDPSERWNSIGQVSGNGNRGSTNTTTSQRKPSIHAGLSASSAAAEPFLGYNELFSPNGSSSLATLDASKSANAAALSTSDPMNVAFRSGSSTDSRAGFALSSSQEQDLVSTRHRHTQSVDQDADVPGGPTSEFPALQERLKHLGDRFRGKLQVLLGDLAYQSDVDLRFLGVSMNFNDVYQPVRRKAKATPAGPSTGALSDRERGAAGGERLSRHE